MVRDERRRCRKEMREDIFELCGCEVEMGSNGERGVWLKGQKRGQEKQF